MKPGGKPCEPHFMKIARTQSTSGFSDTDKTTAVVCGGSTPLLSGKNNIIFPDSAEREYTTATHTYSPEPQGFQTTANHRKAPNDTVGKAPSDQSTSGGNDVSEEAQKTPICGGSFKNSESDVDCQGLSEEHTSLFIDYAQMVRQHEKSVLMWQAPDSGFKNSPFGKEEHIKFTKSLLRSGEFDKIKAALEAMQRTLGEYGEGRKHG